MQGSFIQPPAWRIVVAFILTPLVTAFAFAFLLSSLNGWQALSGGFFLIVWAYAAFGAYLPALVFGIPALFILRKRVRATPLNCGIVGFIVAVAPYLMVFIYEVGRNRHAFLEGPGLALLPFVAAVGLAGILAGLIFWTIAVAGAKQKTPRPVNIGIGT